MWLKLYDLMFWVCSGSLYCAKNWVIYQYYSEWAALSKLKWANWCKNELRLRKSHPVKTRIHPKIHIRHLPNTWYSGFAPVSEKWAVLSYKLLSAKEEALQESHLLLWIDLGWVGKKLTPGGTPYTGCEELGIVESHRWQGNPRVT